MAPGESNPENKGNNNYGRKQKKYGSANPKQIIATEKVSDVPAPDLTPSLEHLTVGKSLNSEQRSNSQSTSRENSSIIQIDVISFRICQVIVPVTLCSLYVVLLTRIIDLNVFRNSPNILDKTWLHLGLPPASISGVVDEEALFKTFINNIIIVAVFFGLIVLVTLIILFVLYMEWHSCLTYYFYMPSFVIMAIITPAYFKELMLSLNWFGVDLITLTILNWNFTALGMMTIFNIYITAPLCLQQFYLIHNSAILAVLMIGALPGWAPWMLLSFLVAWDLFAVLAPFGPLNLIISMAEREGLIDMPGLIYTTDTRKSDDDTRARDNYNKEGSDIDGDSSRKNHNERTGLRQRSRSERGEQRMESAKTIDEIGHRELDNLLREQNEEPKSSSDRQQNQQLPFEERGINIGLGDFIFYSLLIGLTSKGRDTNDFYTTLATLDTILVGLVLTLIILAVTRHALPALPLAIGMGLSIAALTSCFVPALANKLAAEQIFI